MQKLLEHKIGWAFLIVAFVAINFLATLFHGKIDLTKEKRYTIGKTTKSLLTKLDDKIEISVFLQGNLPSGFKKLANTTNDFLQLLKENNTKISYRFIAPDETMDESEVTYQDSLIALGATPINLTVQIKQGQQQQLIFPYALISYQGATELVNLYNGQSRLISQDEINGAEAMMEYKFLKAFSTLSTQEKPMVAYSYGNGEPTNIKTYDILQTLQKDYNLFTFDLNKRSVIPDTFNVLMIVKPSQQFTEAEKLKIDQYLLRGGKVLLCIDNLNAEQDSLNLQPELVAFDRNLNLTDLLFKYGIRINTDLVMDLQCDFMPFAVAGSADKPQYEFLRWNYYPLFESKNNHPINKNLGLVAGRFVNSIDTVKANAIQKTILLSSSSNARKISTPALISLNENRNAPEDALFNQKDIPVAVLLEGKFTSLYKNRIDINTLDSLKGFGTPYIAESNGKGKMIVLADGDFVLNDASQKQGPLPMGTNIFTAGSQYEYQFANREFLLNCLEYLTNNQGIIEARNKEVVLRLLNGKLIEQDEQKWQIINLTLPITIVILAGFAYNQYRRRRYAA